MSSTAYHLRVADWQRLVSSDEWNSWDSALWFSHVLSGVQELIKLSLDDEAATLSVETSGSAGVKLFKELTFYGRYGALLSELPKSESMRWIGEGINAAKRIRELAPATPEDDNPDRVIAVAEARSQIDSGSGDITPLGLALIGGASEGRIRNLMFGAGALFTAVNGRIPVSQALGWLDGRSGYWPSIWNEDQVPANADEIVTVPKASDGTVFHPALRRRSGYMIGPKGSEEVVENYDVALARLAQMSEPRWRRPNSERNWGIVKGTTWVEMSRHELNQFRT